MQTFVATLIVSTLNRVCKMEIEKEIVQTKFESAAQKAIINIAFTQSWLQSRSAERLKPFGITVQQYNILRILRGQHPKPATITLLTERMIDKMSNASRLVEKLLAKGFVERNECPSDRRQVHVAITDAGLELLARMEPLFTAEYQNLARLSDEEYLQLSNLLDRLRG
jgi:DNA-binding MarR family transcriptional regulator